MARRLLVCPRLRPSSLRPSYPLSPQLRPRQKVLRLRAIAQAPPSPNQTLQCALSETWLTHSQPPFWSCWPLTWPCKTDHPQKKTFSLADTPGLVSVDTICADHDTVFSVLGPFSGTLPFYPRFAWTLPGYLSGYDTTVLIMNLMSFNSW